MLKSLRIQNFRTLTDFEIPKLGRINLIVGKNNSGKSTVLEALRIYARQANPLFLAEIIGSHDEQIATIEPDSIDGDFGEGMSYQHFFPGRCFPKHDGEAIYIGNREGSDFVRIDHCHYIDEFEETADEAGETVRRRRRQIVPKEKLQQTEFAEQALQVSSSSSSRQGWIDIEPQSTYAFGRRYGLFWDEAKETPISFVPTQFLSLEYLASLWDNIALTANEEFVSKALQVIDPDVRGLVFIQRNSSRPVRRRPGERNGDRTAIVRLASQSGPIPLNSMGDGMLRILQLILALFPAKGGLLLIDEFENGLHYSVQEQTWELIFKLAKKLNIQIFATTHSWDCIEAFKNAALQSPETGVLFRLGRSVKKSDKGKVIATVFDEDDFVKLTQADVEVR